MDALKSIMQPLAPSHCDFLVAGLSKCSCLVNILLHRCVVPAQDSTLTLARFQLVFLRVDMMAECLVAVGVEKLDFDFWFKVNACWLTSGHTRL